MRLTPKETICGGQMVLNGKRSPVGLLTHHHCAGATVPRPCKGRITSTRASPLYSNKQWVHGPSLYPPFARAGDQPQGWWWVRRRNTRRRPPSCTGPWGTWSQRPEKTPRPQRRRGSPKASPTRPPRGLCSPATDATNRSILVPWSKGGRTRGSG